MIVQKEVSGISSLITHLLAIVTGLSKDNKKKRCTPKVGRMKGWGVENTQKARLVQQ